MGSPRVRVFVALGSNLGDRERTLAQARAQLAHLPDTELVGESGIYETAPLGGPEQGDYLNQVVELHTGLSPWELLAQLQQIERNCGRERLVRWGPRTLDLDILWYHGFSSSDPRLEVPHPRMEERRFVLEPLAELAPDLILPSGRTVGEALESVRGQEARRLRQGARAMCGGSMDSQKDLRLEQERPHVETQRLQEETQRLQEKIRELARQKGAIILAHNYQRPEVQEVADLVGDSLELSRQAAAAQARMIVFCGVHFMAETAAILAPESLVVIPEPEAGCTLADKVEVEELLALKARHPGALVVSYVNTTAAVKALSDICCTSANAAQVIASLPGDREIIFVPDRNLGAWAAKKAGRELVLWPGFCPTHELITLDDVKQARLCHPGAKLVVHPECRPEIAEAADAVKGTSGMLRYCREEEAAEFLIGTEVGMLARLRRELPHKRFYPVTQLAVCPFMKMTTLEKLLRALQEEQPVVRVEPVLRERALGAVQRMIEVGG